MLKTIMALYPLHCQKIWSLKCSREALENGAEFMLRINLGLTLRTSK